MVAVGSTVLTDSLACFRSLADAGSDHEAIVTGSGRGAARHPPFMRSRHRSDACGVRVSG